MPKLIILGAAGAVPDENHENAHMVLHGPHGAVLIDCTGKPLVRLKQAGIHYNELRDLILTHFHPDHASSVPNLLMNSWLLGRQLPLRIYGLHHCLQRVENLMNAYHWDRWPGFFPVVFHHLPQRENIVVMENDDFRILASPVRHFVPTIGLRVEVKATGFVFAYSSDTVPCPEVVRLAYGADLLIHEATFGDEPLGHSSGAQAGAVAQEAQAKRLGLIHYPVWDADPAPLVDQARTNFSGEVFLCEEFMEVELGQPGQPPSG